MLALKSWSDKGCVMHRIKVSDVETDRYRFSVSQVSCGIALKMLKTHVRTSLFFVRIMLLCVHHVYILCNL